MLEKIALQVTDLHKHFGTVRAVDGVSFRVPQGSVMALLGPNGAGKTTTLDMVLNLARPTSGTIKVLGGTPATAIAHGRISAVLQTGGLLGDMRVHEALAWIAATYGGDVARPENLSRVLEQAGIASIAKRKIRKCSGGEQQRIKFALSLLPDPDLLILDEPTAGMDAQARHDFWGVMRGQARAGKTIIFATHYLQEAQDYASRVILMNHGKVIADGSAAEITARQQRVVFFTAPDAAVSTIRERYPAVASAGGGRYRLSLGKTDEFVRFALGVPGVENLEIAAPSLEQAFFELTGGGSGEHPDSGPAPHEAAVRAPHSPNASNEPNPTSASNETHMTSPTNSTNSTNPTDPTREED